MQVQLRWLNDTSTYLFFVRIAVNATQLCCNLAISLQGAGATEPGEGPVVVQPKPPCVKKGYAKSAARTNSGLAPSRPRSAETG